MFFLICFISLSLQSMQDILCNDFIGEVQTSAVLNRFNRSKVFSHSWLSSLASCTPQVKEPHLVISAPQSYSL